MSHSYYKGSKQMLDPYSKLILPPMVKEKGNHNEFSINSSNFRENLDEIKERRRSSFSNHLETSAGVKLKSKLPECKISNLSLATRNKSQIPNLNGISWDKN